MARIKKSSKILEESNARLAGIKSINPQLDLGNGMTTQIFGEKIIDVATTLNEYNTMLSTIDEKLSIFEQKELELKDFHERILLAVAVKYGKDSVEYEMAGGTKKSDRKKPTKPTVNKET